VEESERIILFKKLWQD